MSFVEAVWLAEAKFGTLGTRGSYTPPARPEDIKGAGIGPSPAYSLSAAVAEVDVDPETGIVDGAERIWIAHDIGQAINPVLVDGPGRGQRLHGPRRGPDGGDGPTGATATWFTGSPRSSSTRARPRWRCATSITYLVEDPDPNGPFGAKEAGQGPQLPIMPAVANAVYDAVGVRIDEVPITPEKVLKAIRSGEKRLRAHRLPRGPVARADRVPTPGRAETGSAGRRARTEAPSRARRAMAR